MPIFWLGTAVTTIKGIGELAVRAQGCKKLVTALVESLQKTQQHPAERSHAWHRDAAALLRQIKWHGASRAGPIRGDTVSELGRRLKLAPARLEFPKRQFPPR